MRCPPTQRRPAIYKQRSGRYRPKEPHHVAHAHDTQDEHDRRRQASKPLKRNGPQHNRQRQPHQKQVHSRALGEKLHPSVVLKDLPPESFAHGTLDSVGKVADRGLAHMHVLKARHRAAQLLVPVVPDTLADSLDHRQAQG